MFNVGGADVGGGSCPEWGVGRVVLRYVNLTVLRIPTSKIVLERRTVNTSVGQPVIRDWGIGVVLGLFFRHAHWTGLSVLFACLVFM